MGKILKCLPKLSKPKHSSMKEVPFDQLHTSIRCAWDESIEVTYRNSPLVDGVEPRKQK